MLAGYVVGFVTIPRYISQQRYLANLAATLGIVLTLGAFVTRWLRIVVGCVAALGFASAR